MNKLILICLLFVVPTAFAATCSNSALADRVGLTALTSSVNSETLSYCTGLEGEDICCSVDTINSLQATIDTAVTATVLEAAARDSYLLTAQAAVTALKSTYKTLQTTAVSAIAKLNTAIAAEATPAASKTLYEEAEEYLVAGPKVVYDLVEEALAAEDDWSKYQAARATCANKIFATQATVACLACRPTPATYAEFASADVTKQLSYTTAYQTTLSGACEPYFAYAKTQNLIAYPYALIENLAALNTLVASINSDITQATSANNANLKKYAQPTAATADYQEIPAVDFTDCTASDCAYTYTTLLDMGTQLVPEYLANGGSITVDSSSSRLLGEARTLVDAFDPTTDANASGVTVDFPEDVIAAASAWRQGGLMTCVVALVAVLLF